ncbi:chemotaxis protein CheC [Anaeromicrobium sediminis]|uniref:CheY-P-specific phosphatase CheC n=1 Tax=Anaeromicrobium sediminis TaxID=1478221 RepID=A0A267MQQ9_9FIRM|nr:chemotaxis protein CheC [Anaeromicrobium sediminis]PAB61248.1 CheY-P-specific phosphatase CheC [Anaeromicrobium sediminis]
MKITLDEINNEQMDVLKEIGNIGAGNATTALATMLNKRIDMKVPKVDILEFNEVTELLGGAEKKICGINFDVDGDINGNIMFLLNMDSSKKLANMLMNKEDHVEELSEWDISALQEVGNILSGAYVRSLTTLTQLDMKISIPSLTVDMAGAILSVPIIQYGQVGDKVLLIETELNEGNNNIKGYFFLIPDVESFEILLKSLGVLE